MEQKGYAKKAAITCRRVRMYFHSMALMGASLDEIAQIAEMHKSNIFYYYENKEALYVEVLTTVMQKWLAPLQALEAELEPVEALTHYLMTKIETAKTQPKASRLFALEVIQGAPHILPILKGPLKNCLNAKLKSFQIGKNKVKFQPELMRLPNFKYLGLNAKLCRFPHPN